MGWEGTHPSSAKKSPVMAPNHDAPLSPLSTTDPGPVPRRPLRDTTLPSLLLLVVVLPLVSVMGAFGCITRG